MIQIIDTAADSMVLFDVAGNEFKAEGGLLESTFKDKIIESNMVLSIFNDV